MKNSPRRVRKRISRIIGSSHRRKALENRGRVQRDRKVESSDLFSREEPASPAGVEIKPESRSLPLFDLEKFFHPRFSLQFISYPLPCSHHPPLLHTGRPLTVSTPCIRDTMNGTRLDRCPVLSIRSFSLPSRENKTG